MFLRQLDRLSYEPGSILSKDDRYFNRVFVDQFLASAHHAKDFFGKLNVLIKDDEQHSNIPFADDEIEAVNVAVEKRDALYRNEMKGAPESGDARVEKKAAVLRGDEMLYLQDIIAHIDPARVLTVDVSETSKQAGRKRANTQFDQFETSTESIGEVLKANPVLGPSNKEKIEGIITSALATDRQFTVLQREFVHSTKNFTLDELRMLRDQYYERVMEPEKQKYGNNYRENKACIAAQNFLIRNDHLFASLQDKIKAQGGGVIEPLALPKETNERGRGFIKGVRERLRGRGRSASPERPVKNEGDELKIILPSNKRK
jgi:hypothetical protein